MINNALVGSFKKIKAYKSGKTTPILEAMTETLIPNF